MKPSFHFSFEFNKTDLVTKYGLEPGGVVQEAITASCIRYMSDYVPFKTGTLANVNPWNFSDMKQGIIVYHGPYAHYMYYGEIYGPNIPYEVDGEGNVIQWRSRAGQKKIPTSRPLKYNKDRNPLAGPFWAERMKADHMQDIVDEAISVAGFS